MEWRHSGSTRPKKFWAQKPLENSHLDFLDGILLIDYLPKSQPINAEYLCWCNWRTFRGKNTAGRSPRGSCSCTTMPWLTGHLQPRRNWPTWAPNVLITHPILRIWPCRTITCSLDWKKQLKGHHFSSNMEVTAAIETWLDGQPSEFFLSGLQKLDKWAKKCIELRGECVE